MKIIRLLPWLSLLMAGCQSEIPRESEVLAIVFDRPAGIWEERLPLGNGRLGAMPDGGVEQENIILNEISLWSGSPAEDIRQGTYRILPVIRELLYKERIPRAQELMYRYFTPRIPGSGGSSGAENSFGSYQVLGEAVLHFPTDNPHHRYLTTPGCWTFRPQRHLLLSALTALPIPGNILLRWTTMS